MDGSSAYRLQLTPQFGFKEATRILPYLKKLHIDAVYTSPYMDIVPYSNNPYQTVSCENVNPALGTMNDLITFCRAIQKKGCFHIIDYIPNHMAASSHNPWWQDVLKRGKQSPYAHYFDIDWEAGDDRLILPILSSPLKQAIKRGEVKLERVRGEYVLQVGVEELPLVGVQSVDEPIEKLILRQHYYLIPWTQAPNQVNYRRFFDINGLVGLRVEDKDVFRASHHFLFRLIDEGLVNGVRVDHPDGLFDPATYFKRLGKKASFDSAEKILQIDEQLPENWDVSGSVGYDYLNDLLGLFIDPRGKQPLETIYARITRKKLSPEKVLFGAKKEYLYTYLKNDIAIISSRLKKEGVLLSVNQLINCLSAFPVYRTYLDGKNSPLLAEDRRYLNKAFSDLKQFAPNLSVKTTKRLKDFFYGRLPGECRKILMRTQQLMPAVCAKGFEDTFCYRYFRLVALNEVGGSPTQFGVSPALFHEKNRLRNLYYPQTMITTDTHDTKRSEDVRMRLAVLSEIPDEWSEVVEECYRVFAKEKKGEMPDRNTEYLFYQTLVGSYTGRVTKKYTERIVSYMIKAVREGKEKSNWISVNAPFEKALECFIRRVLKRLEQSDLHRFIARVSELGKSNSLSARILRLGSPGIFDVYQGTESWNYTLVDPDNRQPVNFRKFEKIPLGHPKFFILKKGLELRGKYPELFVGGDYIPLKVTGKGKEQVIAFARKTQQEVAIVYALRFPTRNFPHEAVIHVPRSLQGMGREIFSGERREWKQKVPLGLLPRGLPGGIFFQKR